MLPSSGHAVRRHPPAWGTDTSIAPRLTSAPMRRFPAIDSPMTRWVELIVIVGGFVKELENLSICIYLKIYWMMVVNKIC